MQKGFTLIEMIVVITIVSVIAGVGALSFKDSNEEKQLEKDAEILADVISQAKTKTISREIPIGMTCTQFNGYSILINTSNQTYTMRIWCNGIATNITTYSLQNTRYSSSTSTVDILFSYPYGTLSVPRSLSIRNASIGRCKPMSVNVNGIVTVNNSVACSS